MQLADVFWGRRYAVIIFRLLNTLRTESFARTKFYEMKKTRNYMKSRPALTHFAINNLFFRASSFRKNG